MGRTRGKSDPIDARAAARAALAEPDLPVAAHDAATRELRLLVDHRDRLVKQRTQTINRLRWHLHNIDPDLHIPGRTLHYAGNLARIQARLDQATDALEARLATELVADIAALTRRIQALDDQLEQRVEAAAPQLLEVPGCAHVTAAKIVAETAGVGRFRSSDAYTAYTGTAPIPASPGNTHRYRLARGGNRQLNTAIHRIALTQIRLPGPGRDYYRRRLTEGKTKTEAIRALKRKIARGALPAPQTRSTVPRAQPLDIGATDTPWTRTSTASDDPPPNP
jgi:transposase